MDSKSRGAEVDFKTTLGDVLTVYTTRCDTLFGATYMVISPEHPLIEKWAGSINNLDEVRAYQQEAARKSDFERTELNKDKTGVCLDGVMGINPVNDTEIPIFISDYVLTSYGTGAIMAVPAHDTRDWEFAKKFNLPIIEVVAGGEDVQKEAFTDCATGTLVNSGFISGMSVEEAKHAMIDWLEKEGKGREKSTSSSETGCSAAKDIGASLFRLLNAKNAVMFRFPKVSFLSACPMLILMSRQIRVNLRLPR